MATVETIISHYPEEKRKSAIIARITRCAS